MRSDEIPLLISSKADGDGEYHARYSLFERSRNGISRVEAKSLSFFRQLRELDLSRNQIVAIDNSSFPRDNQLDALWA